MTVHLVGAGPGDPELLTVRAHRLLAAADVVIHDRLVGPAVLALAGRARLVDVGKLPGGSHQAQADINRLLIEEGRGGGTVVRLKGGDPYLFGRGGEEAADLRVAGIDVEVVPGVSSALAAPAAAGIPVTHRTVSAGVTIVTGSTADDSSGVDWPTLAALDHTLVVLMGVGRAPELAATLIEHGRRPIEPVAVVGSGTLAGQRTVRTTLERLDRVDVPAPATIVIGPVAALADLPEWVPSQASTSDSVSASASASGRSSVASTSAPLLSDRASAPDPTTPAQTTVVTVAAPGGTRP
ncbi:MAG: uroporphyrinogen-III C-methyltransferase [Actinomycetota bacterium]